MDILTFLRTVAALGTVLGLLAGALWAVRRYNIALPGQTGARTGRRLALVERVGIDGKRAVILIRRDDREHLIMVAPEGQTVIETNIIYQLPEAEAAEIVAEAPAAKLQQDFATLVDLVGSAGKRAKAAFARNTRPAVAARAAEGDAALAGPDFAAMVESAGSAGAVESAVTVRAKPSKARPRAAAPAQAKPAPVRLKVTTPDGRTIVEPTPAGARASVAQAA